LIIKSCHGYELEKESAKSFEDYFNRSELIFEEDGREKVFRVLYLRYFEEMLHECTPYQQNPIFKAGNREVELKDIVALVCMIKHSAYRERKNIYINEWTEFSRFFEGLNFHTIQANFQELGTHKSSLLRSPQDYLLQLNKN
jgi:hypothetical protein